MEQPTKGKLVEVNHPLIEHKLATLRDKTTSYKVFRGTLNELTALMAFEVTRDFPLVEKEVETPICKTTCKILASEKVTLVPVLRAGLGMVDGLASMLPSVKIGHIGIKRNHETLQPEPYYLNFPADIAQTFVVLVDPMLATGGTICYAIKKLKEYNVQNIRIMCLVACPEGIKKVHDAYPEVSIYTAKVDEKLNENGYIVPGLGDAGDRIFGTT
jgi:uracil phosphoribosyltransferase